MSHLSHRLTQSTISQSLGCTLYALAYNRSPFETAEQAGGSIAMAVQSGAYKHSSTTAYSQGMRDVIDACLKVDSRERPDIHKVRLPLLLFIELVC